MRADPRRRDGRQRHPARPAGRAPPVRRAAPAARLARLARGVRRRRRRSCRRPVPVLGRRDATPARACRRDAAARAEPVFDQMRTELMGGQYLDLLEQAQRRRLGRAGPARDPLQAREVHGRAAAASRRRRWPARGADAARGVRRVRAAARRGVPAARRRARRLRRPDGDRQAGRRRPARGQAHRAGRARRSSGARRPQAAAAARQPRRPAPRTPTASTRCARSSSTPARSPQVEALIAALHRRGAADAGARPASTGAGPRRCSRELGRVAATAARPVRGCAQRHRPDRPRRRRRRRARRPVGGAAAGRGRPAGDGAGARGGARRPGRAARADGGYRFDTGPTVLTMPDLIADALDCVGERLADWLDPRPGRRRSTARSTPTARRSTCTPTSTRWPPRSRACAGRPRPPATGGTSTSCRSSTGSRCATSSTATSTRRSTCSRPTLARLAAIGGFRRLAPKVAQYLTDPRHPAGVLVPGDVRRALARTTRSRSTPSSPTWTRSPGCSSRAAGCTRCRGRSPARPRSTASSIRYGDDGDPRRDCAAAAPWPCTPPDGERVAVRRRRAQPRPAGRVPRPARAEPWRAAADATRRRASCCSPGRRATYPATAHHTIHFGHAWREVFDELIHERPADERPVVPGDEPDARPTRRWRRRARQSTTCCSRRRTSTPPSTGASTGPRYRDEVVRDARGARLRRASATASRSST